MGAVPLPRLLRKEVASNGGSWLPVVLVLGAIAAVAYADHIVVSISLVYLYILPLAVSDFPPEENQLQPHRRVYLAS
jgi:hypothetical protein